MIVKTGANYQNDGGYIEFADGQNYSIINDRVIPGVVYSTTTNIISILPLRASVKTSDIICSLFTFRRETVEGHESFFTYVFLPLNTTPQIVNVATNYGMRLSTTVEGTIVLAEGSQDVELVYEGGVVYVIITGPNPVLIVTLEE